MCEEGWHGGQCDFRPSCEYWDVDLLAFSSYGCQLDSYDTASGQVVCACNHLTEFSTLMQSAFTSNQSWEEVFTVFPY